MLSRSAAGNAVMVVVGDALQQLGVGLVGERVLAVRTRFAGVEIGIRQIEPPASERVEGGAESLSRPFEAFEKQRLRFGVGALNCSGRSGPIFGSSL